MFKVYESGGILLGQAPTLSLAQDILLKCKIGWISLNGKIIEKRGFK